MSELTAAEVMTTMLVTVSPDDSLFAAWELLSRGRFHHLPVVRDKRCVGVVDDRSLALDWMVSPLTGPRRKVGEILPPRVHCVLAGTPVSEVARVMLGERATAVPVVEPGMGLLGLVTVTDLVTLVADGTLRPGGEGDPPGELGADAAGTGADGAVPAERGGALREVS